MKMDHTWHTAVTISCITVTAILESAEEGLTHWPHIDAFFSGYGWIHYVPALLLTIAGFFWFLGRLRKEKTIPDSEADQIIKDVKLQGAQCIILCFMEARAIDLQTQLEALWHHWDNAGEKLIHPLNATLDKLKGDDWNLLHERRDFMVLYAHHLRTLKAELPEFTSATVETGYPSDSEYHQVLANLKMHAEKLKIESEKAWDKY